MFKRIQNSQGLNFKFYRELPHLSNMVVHAPEGFFLEIILSSDEF